MNKLSWSYGDSTITLNDILNYASDPILDDPNVYESLLIQTNRDSQRINSADTRYPILVSILNNKVHKIIDGQHRVVNAIKNNSLIKVRFVNLDKAPKKYRNVFE